MSRILASALLITALGATTFACSGEDVIPAGDETGASTGGTNGGNGGADTTPVDGVNDPTTCTPNGASRCGDDGQVDVCSAGLWVDSHACNPGEMCTDGVCVPSACVGSCEGKVCGDDGCGGNCGNCESGWSCIEGACEETGCIGSCEGKDCGDDGCGNVCGVCAAGNVCNADGQCVLEGSEGCQASCVNKECGDDGCGGMCGMCAAGNVCNADGKCVLESPDCVPSCEGMVCGNDGCGGSCGTCGDGETCTDGMCMADGGGDGCGGVTYEGCCDGLVLTWCEDGELVTIDCAESETPSCGWLADQGFYDCGQEGAGPPEFPIECAGDAPCVPSCMGMECGDDGCGGSCGTCGDGTTCNAGLCEGEPEPEGACTNPTDEAITSAEDVTGLATEAAMSCMAEPDMTACVASSVSEQTGLSTECALCYGAVVGCVIDNCLTDCMADAASEQCVSCQVESGCVADFAECSGLGDGGSTCEPMCDGMACGDDGCGGSCGTCDAGQVCDAGACVDDGPVDPCGGITYEGCCDDLVLTWCEAGEVMTIDCAEAPNPSCGWAETQGYYNCGEVGPGPDEFPLECSASCVPSCENMVCGDDGCGGICGTCGDGTTCDAGQCVENPAPTGACTNDGDAAIIEAQDVELLAEEAAIECLGDPDTTNCIADVLSTATGLSDACSTCYGGLIACTVDNCLAECVNTGADGGAACQSCQAASGCLADFTACSGVEVEVPCTPSCDGQVCGDDGCGGICGTCGDGQVCDAGACVDDGPVDPCGGITYEGCCDGTILSYCEDGELLVFDCSEGETTCGWDEGNAYYSCGEEGSGPPEHPIECGVCNPSCEGVTCGDDGCGGSCGTCGDGTTCNDGLCVDEPNADGACTNAADLAITNDQDVATLAQEAAMTCLGNADVNGCVAASVTDQTGLSDGCALCYGEIVGCIIANCIVDCMADAAGEACLGCQAESGCLADFEECSGLGGDPQCTPNCEDVMCGDDGCGGSCGTCGDGTDCEAGQCVGDPAPTEGACLNDSDSAIAEDQDVAALAQELALGCLSTPDVPTCVTEGLADQTGLSEDCAGCYGELVICGLAECLAECVVDAESDACQTCQADSCLPAFEACSGVETTVDPEPEPEGLSCADLNSCLAECPAGDAACEAACKAAAAPASLEALDTAIACLTACDFDAACAAAECADLAAACLYPEETGDGDCAGLFACTEACASDDDACFEGCFDAVSSEGYKHWQTSIWCANYECLDASSQAEYDACFEEALNSEECAPYYGNCTDEVPPETGTTCSEVVDCTGECADDATCEEACLNAGTEDAATEYLAMTGCIEDCDNALGCALEECADEGAMCFWPGEGSLNCMGVNDCFTTCETGDGDCTTACLDEGTEAAQQIWVQIIWCTNTVCTGLEGEESSICTTEAMSDGGDCAMYSDACQTDG